MGRYVSYARKNCHPRLTAPAKERLIEHYVEMRQLGERNKTITATPRQLESLIRLAEANARMRLSPDVTGPPSAATSPGPNLALSHAI